MTLNGYFIAGSIEGTPSELGVCNRTEHLRLYNYCSIYNVVCQCFNVKIGYSASVCLKIHFKVLITFFSFFHFTSNFKLSNNVLRILAPTAPGASVALFGMVTHSLAVLRHTFHLPLRCLTVSFLSWCFILRCSVCTHLPALCLFLFGSCVSMPA